jgi:hypothetical protein
MAVNRQMWVHGNAFAPAEAPGPGYFGNINSSLPWTDIVGLHQGFGATWQGKPNTQNWFHIAVPTPAVADDTPLYLDKVYVLYALPIETFASVRATVDEVTVWHGQRLLQRFDSVAGVGDHCAGIDADGSNTFNIIFNQPLEATGLSPAAGGIGISVHVRFHHADPSRVRFCGAGAEFTIG